MVITQEINPALKCPQSECNVMFEKQTLAGAGGSAYDGRLRGLWISNGQDLACVDTSTQDEHPTRRDHRRQRITVELERNRLPGHHIFRALVQRPLDPGDDLVNFRRGRI